MAEQSLRQRAGALMDTTPLIDGHNDLPWQLRMQFQNQIVVNNKAKAFREGLDTFHTDLAKLRRSKLGGQFWSVYVGCGPENDNWEDDQHAVRDTLEQIDIIKRLIVENDELEYCTTPDAVTKAFKGHRIASMLGAEGLHQAGGSIGVIRQLFELGVRYITLTHNVNNAFATCHMTKAEDIGLTELGAAGVKEMNRLGMLVDLSHVSVKTMDHTLDTTRSPVIFSHSGARGLSEHSRNVPDRVLERVKQNRGIVMVPFVRRFIKADNPDIVAVDHVADHIFHVAKVCGWDHVGVGADFDGVKDLPIGMDDVSCYPDLIETVLSRGATDEQVRKLMGENILRVWREVELVAESLAKQGEKPWETNAPGRTWAWPEHL